jgi:uncharacterized membrane protein
MADITRAVALGAATGARSMTPLALLTRRPPVLIAAAGELVADKLPQTPSRVMPIALAGRLALGALAGGLDAKRRKDNVAVAALVAAGAAAAASYGGLAWRTYAARHRFPIPAALVEDAAAVAVAWVVTRKR